MPTLYRLTFSTLFAITLLAAHGLVPGPVSAAGEVTLKSETLVRFMERDTATETDALVIPTYEYLQFDLGGNGFSFHAQGWGRADLADTGFFDDQTVGELLHGYLEYRPARNGLRLRLGRQAIIAGVTNESIDGLSLTIPASSTLSFALYGGQPVALSNTNSRDGDVSYGGRIGVQRTHLDLGLSYKMIKNNSLDTEEMAGIDYGLTFGTISISGISSYNLFTEDFAEHAFDTLLPVGKNRFRAFYQLYSFADYFGTGANNANPFRILAQTSEELTSYGLEITRRVDEGFEFGVKLIQNDYAHKEASSYGALLANWSGTETMSIGGEVGYSAGENGRNDMILARAYVLRALPGEFLFDQISLDLLYAAYDQTIFNEDTSLSAVLTGNRNLTDRLRLKLSADYESGPYFDRDVRGLVSLAYYYSAN